MKTKNLFRVLAVATLFAVVSTNSFSQYLLAPAQGGAVGYDNATSDYITIGSRLPYFVAPDPAIIALQPASMHQSQFKWEFLDNTLNPIAVQPAVTEGDATPMVAGGAAGYYVANEIAVTWAAASVTAGNFYVVRATEHSIPPTDVFAEGCDDATPEVRSVYVIDRPTITFPATSFTSPCGTTPGAASHFFVPINVTGLGTWNVTFSVDYNGAAYVASSEITGFGAATAATDLTVFGAASLVKSLPGTPTAGNQGLDVLLNGGTAANGYGRYVVTVSNVTDRISRKSMDVIASQAGDLPASTYTIFVVPTPVTQPIQHRVNLGW